MSLQTDITAIVLCFIPLVLAKNDCPTRFLRHPTRPVCEETPHGCKILQGQNDWNIPEILNTHNSLRNKIASGKHGFPEAADMMQLEYDDELALHAQKFCELCDATQGLMVATTADFRDKDAWNHFTYDSSISWTTLIERSHSILKALLDNPSPDKSTIDSYFKLGVQLNHINYQLLQARMWTVGVGWAWFENSVRKGLSIFYFGFYTESPHPFRYIRGKAASRCPNNTRPSPQYPALCKSLTKLGPTDIDIPAVRDSADTLFFCDFPDETLCGLRFAHSTDDRVSAIETDRYSYVSILIKGGETATITFPENLQSYVEVCLNVDYAHGPSVYGTARASVVTVQHALGRKILDRKTEGNLWGVGSMMIEVRKGKPLTWSITSPSGSPEEFFEVRRIIISDDMSLCQ